MDRKTIALLLCILTISAIVRMWGLNKSPLSLNWDEAALGYNAYSLLLTGRDEFGSAFPMSLRSFDDFKPPLYSYMSVPVIKFWGLNDVSTRLVSAVAGIVSVLVVFALTYQLRGRSTAIWTSLLMAIQPWSIVFSRGAWEANLALLLTLTAILAGTRKKYGAALCMGTLAIFTYHSAKVYLFLLVIWLIFKSKSIRVTFFSGVILLVAAVYMVTGGGLARFSSAKLPDFNVADITGRYLSYFSPANIFVRGSEEATQTVGGYGMFYVWQSALLFLGVCILASKKSLKDYWYWLAVAPIPAAIAKSWFSPVRNLLVLALLTVCMGEGARFVWKKSRLATFVLGTVGIVMCGWFLIDIFWVWPYKNYGSWQWGAKEVMSYINPIMDNYNQIIWETGQAQPHIFALYYGRYSPSLYHNDLAKMGGVPIPRKNFDFGKFIFRKIYWPDDNALTKTIFIGSVYSVPLEEAKFRIYDPQGYETYRIAIKN